MDIKLGQRVKDISTGMVGVTTQRSEHLNGCIRFVIQPPVDKDGKFIDGVWVDEHTLQFIEDTPLSKTEQTKTGGPSIRVKRDKI